MPYLREALTTDAVHKYFGHLITDGGYVTRLVPHVALKYSKLCIFHCFFRTVRSYEEQICNCNNT